jgi:hypothetical protein
MFLLVRSYGYKCAQPTGTGPAPNRKGCVRIGHTPSKVKTWGDDRDSVVELAVVRSRYELCFVSIASLFQVSF